MCIVIQYKKELLPRPLFIYTHIQHFTCDRSKIIIFTVKEGLNNKVDFCVLFSKMISFVLATISFVTHKKNKLKIQYNSLCNHNLLLFPFPSLFSFPTLYHIIKSCP